jgi:hypothetical protein
MGDKDVAIMYYVAFLIILFIVVPSCNGWERNAGENRQEDTKDKGYERNHS